MGDCHSSGKERDAGTHAEQALRASELNYRRLFEAAQDGILILDADTGRIQVVWRDGKEVGFPCSLRGFTKGLSAIGWKTFKRKSWLGALLP